MKDLEGKFIGPMGGHIFLPESGANMSVPESMQPCGEQLTEDCRQHSAGTQCDVYLS